MAAQNRSQNLKIRPLDDRVVVEPVEAEERTAGGIVLPETAKEKPKTGKVIALGNGVLNKDKGTWMPFSVKKGDTVIFSAYSGTEVKIDAETFLIMTEEDILGVID